MKVVALAGGVGGAKLADGLARILPSEDLTIVVNTGDDFEHLGLKICPDLDTVCYTLAGIANPATGWGRAEETWFVIENLAQLGGPTWFRLGDRDLGTHLERTRRIRAGESLTRITKEFCQAWGVKVRVLPMSDDPIPTKVDTNEGEMPFQEYFVKRQCHPRVTGFCFDGAEDTKPAPGVIEAIKEANLVVICPSNPWVSIDPILAVPGIRLSLEDRQIVGVSPIIGGQAVKGPAAKMYQELGFQASARAVAQHYKDLLRGFLIDNVDLELADEIQRLGVRPHVTDIFMKTTEDRIRLAKELLMFFNKIIQKQGEILG